MSKITKKAFIADVTKEINSLKEHATEAELSKLNLNSFDYSSPINCIYGQMTGNCCSNRAKELMDKSCIRVMNLDDGVNDIENKTFTEINNEGGINGEYIGQTWVGDMFRTYKFISVLEGYIVLKGAKHKNIISYLKGETDTLKL